jgi:NitT/TauT family transport system substrate-binding protein
MRSWRRNVLLGVFGIAFVAASVNFLWLHAHQRNGMSQSGHLKKVVYIVGTADLNISYPYVTLAKALGYFQQEGLDVQIVPGQSSAATIQLLLTKRGDVGVAQPDPVIIQRANNGVPLVSFYPISRRGNNIIITKEGSPIKSVRDLRGKRIGVSDLGSGGVIDLSMKLREVGMSLRDVNLISTGYGVPGYEALDNGSVDASESQPVGVAREERAGYKVVVLPRTPAEDNLYSYNLFARSDYIAENPDVIAKIGRATAKATIFAKVNPAAAVKIFWRQYPDRAPKDINSKAAFDSDLALVTAQLDDLGVLRVPVDFAWGSQSASVYAYIQSNLVAAGLIHQPVDPHDFFTSKFENEYVRFDHQAVVRQAMLAAR